MKLFTVFQKLRGVILKRETPIKLECIPKLRNPEIRSQ